MTRSVPTGDRRAVLHLITTLDRGGAEIALLHLCRAFATGERGARWAPQVAYLKGAGELRPEFEASGVPVHDLRMRGMRGVGGYGRAKRLVARLRPAVVHTHLFKADTLGAAVLGRRGPGRALLVSTKHNEDRYLEGGSPKAAAWREVARRVARRADWVVAITEAVAEFFLREVGSDFAQMATIPYGIPVPPLRHQAGARKRLGVGADEELIVCAARFDRQKDHETLIRAMPAVTAARPKARLVLLGRGPLEEELRERAAATAGANVTFGGFVDNVASWYDAADVVALPSRWEGLGLTLVEAAMHARPVVATAVGGIPEIVPHGRTGLLVNEGDPFGMAEAIVRLLSDPAMRERLGGAARERAIRRFSVEVAANATEDLYVTLLGYHP